MRLHEIEDRIFESFSRKSLLPFVAWACCVSNVMQNPIIPSPETISAAASQTYAVLLVALLGWEGLLCADQAACLHFQITQSCPTQVMQKPML